MNSKDNWNWIFKGFVDANKNDLIQNWYDDQTPPVKAEFDSLLQGIRRRPNHEWSAMRNATALSGKNKQGLIELRFKVERVQYRPIGIFGPERSIFTIVIVAGKSDFEAKCKLAIERKKLIELNPGMHTNESSCLSEFTRKTPK
jgi:hypothetical protein